MMAVERQNSLDLDLTKFPLLALTLEESDTSDPDGFYDEETDTWSHRNWLGWTPKKHNEEN
jgi:hypothetical protein